MAFRFAYAGVTVRVQVQSLLPRLFGRDGLTLGRTIYLAHGQATVSGYLLAHEVGHVLQWRRLGVVRFLWRYLSGMVRHGYAAHPMEAEAHAFGLREAETLEPWAKAIRGGT